MRSKFSMTASMTALLAAAAVCITGVAVGETLAGSPRADVNTENGAHAVPSVPVGEATLGKPGAEPAAAPAPAAAIQVATAEPEMGSEEAAVYRRAAVPAQPAADASPRFTRVDDEAPPPSSIGQHVAFPRRSAEAASAFDGYMHAVAAIDAGFKSGQGVAAALRRASAYDAHQLEEGMIAYGAMAAMQSPRFVYGVMDAAQDPRTRRELIETLVADPNAAARLPGADEASSLASGAILREARPVVDNGHALKQASYDVQHQSWSIAKATDQPGRLAQAKAASQVRAAPHEGDLSRLLGQIATVTVESGRLAAPSPVVAHSLALAALAILDGTQGSDEGRLDQVVSEKDSADCLKMAKLNLFQCLSVAGPEYEDVYCLGQHAVLDTGQCVAGGAGTSSSTVLLPEPARYSRRPQ
jgi:hypothetical protein